MTKSRLAFGAFLLTAVIVAAPAWAAPDQKRVAAEACKGAVCRLTVRVEGDCGISVDPEWLFVSGQNVRLIWEILPDGFVFPPDGVRFKDEYNPEWRSQFYQGEGEIFSTDVLQVGPFKPTQQPRQQTAWSDLNSDRGVFRYSVTVVNSRTSQECRTDPGVVNDW